jgi:RNA polymerase sigma-70 factor (ECF subfamily)
MMQFAAEDEALARLFTEVAGGVLSVLVGQLRDLDLGEAALQDAVAEAVVSWRRDRPPRNGAGWLLTAAPRRAIDRIRRAATARDESTRREILARQEDHGGAAVGDQPIPDERLRLIFTCCHPALGQEARVTLTLRTLCGLSMPEIALVYLVSEFTMSQRLVRAKNKIRATAIPYEVPEGHELAERLASVLDVIYLIFNEGFVATEGTSPTRADLGIEAIRLSRILYQLMPHPKSGGLLALMLLHDARRDVRTDVAGAYIPIAEQDRTRWNHGPVEQGTRLLLYCLGQHRPGPFQFQTAISAVHAEAPSNDTTGWEQIAGLYAALSEMAPTAVVTLNCGVAVANAVTAEAGLALLVAVAHELDDYQPLHAAHAELLKRCGRCSEAARAYRKAIALSANASKRNFLEGRLARLAGKSWPEWPTWWLL